MTQLRLEYPPKADGKWPPFGYESTMCHLALCRDDPEAFMRFLEPIGGIKCQVLISRNLLTYAASHGGEKCLEALFKAGAKCDYYTNDELREIAKKPSHGPRGPQRHSA